MQFAHKVIHLIYQQRRVANEGLANLTGLNESNSIPLRFTRVSYPLLPCLPLILMYKLSIPRHL